MYLANTVMPGIEYKLDGIKETIENNEVMTNAEAYNAGRYSGAIEMALFILRELCVPDDVAIGLRNGKHVIRPIMS